MAEKTGAVKVKSQNVIRWCRQGNEQKSQRELLRQGERGGEGKSRNNVDPLALQNREGMNGNQTSGVQWAIQLNRPRGSKLG